MNEINLKSTSTSNTFLLVYYSSSIHHLLSFVSKIATSILSLCLFVLGRKNLRIRNAIIYSRASNNCILQETSYHWPSQITRAAHIRSQSSDIEIISRKSQWSSRKNVDIGRLPGLYCFSPEGARGERRYRWLSGIQRSTLPSTVPRHHPRWLATAT